MKLKPFVKSSAFVSICMLLLTFSSSMAEPDIDFITSQRDQAIGHIKKGNYEQANVIVADLVTNHRESDKAGNCIWRIAAGYSRLDNHEKAKELCEMALTTWPNHSEYKHTVSKLAEVSIRAAGADNFDAATKELIKKHPKDKDIIRDYLRREAAHFSRYGHLSLAQEMSRAILENFPVDEGDIWARAGVVSSHLILGNTSQADAALTGLISDFGKDKDFAETMNWLAGEYVKASDTAKAMALYELVLRQPPSDLSKHPTSYFKLVAHKGIALISVSCGDTATADAQLAIIEGDYIKERGYDEAVFEIAEAYFTRGRQALQEEDQEQADADFSKAIAIWQRNMAHFDDPRRLCNTYYYIGMSFQGLQDYLKASQSFASAYQQDPAFEHADCCLYSQGYCFEMLMEEGDIPQADAMTLIVTHYQEFLSKFPDSVYAHDAQQWLDSNL
jgi:tetratricopeptide (TPR) repeat protein